MCRIFLKQTINGNSKTLRYNHQSFVVIIVYKSVWALTFQEKLNRKKTKDNGEKCNLGEFGSE